MFTVLIAQAAAPVVSTDPLQTLLNKTLSWAVEAGPVTLILCLVIGWLLHRMNKLEVKLEAANTAKEEIRVEAKEEFYQSELATVKVMEQLGKTVENLIASSNENNARVQWLKDFVVAKSAEMMDAIGKNNQGKHHATDGESK